MMVEGIHFNQKYSTPKQLGHRALAINLSDLAAMGAEPLYALVSLAIPRSLNEDYIEAFYQGMQPLLKKYETDLIGGNISQSKDKFIIDVCVIGEASDRYCTRSGAQPGDTLAVTGPLGGSAVGLHCLIKGGEKALASHAEATKLHLHPEPCILEAQALAGTGFVTAMIDISDGLASEVHHLCRSSGMGMEVHEDKIPISDSTRVSAQFAKVNVQEAVLHGGEDYELLLTLKSNGVNEAKAAMKALGKDLFPIGRVHAPNFGIHIINASGKRSLPDVGWNHFK